MSSTRSPRSDSLVVRKGQTLIALPEIENGEPIMRYFVDDTNDSSLTRDEIIQRARELAGAWSDLDWDEAVDELDRIRHESIPTPPVDLDDVL